MEVPECDYIISNPPYSAKTEVLQRLFEIRKPFAMLVGVVGLFESQKRFEMFKNNKFEIKELLISNHTMNKNHHLIHHFQVCMFAKIFCQNK